MNSKYSYLTHIQGTTALGMKLRHKYMCVFFLRFKSKYGF